MEDQLFVSFTSGYTWLPRFWDPFCTMFPLFKWEVGRYFKVLHGHGETKKSHGIKVQEKLSNPVFICYNDINDQ